MAPPSRPTLHAIVQAAVEATGASSGWLLRVLDDRFEVVAAHGHPRSGELVGSWRPVAGVAGFVAESGQPAAMQLGIDDADNRGAGGVVGQPAAVLATPCGHDEVLGVIELADPTGGAFGFDDVETVGLLADVAGSALADTSFAAIPPSPSVLGEGLARLAAADAVRYAAVARAVEALL